MNGAMDRPPVAADNVHRAAAWMLLLQGDKRGVDIARSDTN
jgi:hypothetical protein